MLESDFMKLVARTPVEKIAKVDSATIQAYQAVDELLEKAHELIRVLKTSKIKWVAYPQALTYEQRAEFYHQKFVECLTEKQILQYENYALEYELEGKRDQALFWLQAKCDRQRRQLKIWQWLYMENTL